MDKSNLSTLNLSTDALVEILVRLPPNNRRRLRLVCRLWRKLIDQRAATDMQRRSKIIAVTDEGNHAFVLDILTLGTKTSLWQQQQQQMMAERIVGTCNGLVCLCDDSTTGGAITVINPSTGEVLRLPPVPIPVCRIKFHSRYWRWHRTYSFAYHPTTGRYKVVRVPCRFSSLSWDPDTVHVFTLGEALWREVRVETDARCGLRSSLTDVDGVVYWLTEDARKIMSFDLKDERITCTEPLPVPATPSTCRLTKVHGRLGLAVGDDFSMAVWVLDGESWIRRYFLEANKMRRRNGWTWTSWREVAVAQFIYGDYFLTFGCSGEVLYRHKMRSKEGVMEKKHMDIGEAVIRLPYSYYRTFSYVETKESLSVYNVDGVGS